MKLKINNQEIDTQEARRRLVEIEEAYRREHSVAARTEAYEAWCDTYAEALLNAVESAVDSYGGYQEIQILNNGKPVRLSSGEPMNTETFHATQMQDGIWSVESHQGEARFLVCHCPDEEDAARIVRALRRDVVVENPSEELIRLCGSEITQSGYEGISGKDRHEGARNVLAAFREAVK